MQVQNMLEKNRFGFIGGNIKLVRIKPDRVEVFKRDGVRLIYENTEKENSKPPVGGEKRLDFDYSASQ